MAIRNSYAAVDAALGVYFERLDRGEQVDIGALIRQFPACASELESFFAGERRLNARLEEINVRSRTAASQETRKSANCLTIRCPHCHAPTQVAADSEFIELTCPSCGSQFGLVDQGQSTTAAPPLMTMGRFELIERLGMGAFGSVWKARDNELDRTVAIKIPRQAGMSVEEHEKFLREARAAAQLSHPNIVRVFEVGREGESVYIVSDFVRGLTLADWLTGQQPTSREAAELCAKIAEALEHAHEKGVVHRDLKPANIMLDADLAPHIMDFGLARRDAGEITMTMEGHVLGTPAYMSPEQAEGKAHTADRRSDVYSLGVIFFQLLTGELPFRGNARMLMHQVIHDDPPSPRKLNSGLPRDLETITLKCLEKEPAKRYHTAREFADELRRFLHGEPIQARPIGRIKRGWRWAKRKPTVALLSAAVLILIAGTIAVLAVSNAKVRRESAARAQALSEKNAALDTATKNEALAKSNEQAAVTNANIAIKNEEIANRRYYAAQLNLAHQAWQKGDPARVLALLEDLRPKPGQEDLRGFEWRYLWQCCHRQCRLQLAGHWGRVTGVAYSPDGKYIASSSLDHTVRLWDASTGKTLNTFEFGEYCGDVKFSPDGKTLAICEGGRVRFYDVLSGNARQLVIRPDCRYGCGISYSPDGAAVAVCGNTPVSASIWDTRSGVCLASLPIKTASTMRHITFSPDGKLVIATLVGSSRIWTWDGAAATQIVSSTLITEHATFSRDSKQIVSNGGLFDIESRQFHQVPKSAYSNSLTHEFSPDGKRVLSGRGDRVAVLWDPLTGEEKARFAHAAPLFAVAFSPDGKTVATAGDDRVIKIWTLAAINEVAREPTILLNHYASFDFLPESDKLILGWKPPLSKATDKLPDIDGELQPGIVQWDSATGKLDVLQRNPGLAAISRDGKTIAYADVVDGTLSLHKAGGDLKTSIAGDAKTAWDFAISPDGSNLAAAKHDGLTLWNTVTREVSTHKIGITHCTNFSPDGEMLFTGGHGAIRVYDPKNGAEIRQIGVAVSTYSVAVSPDARWVAAGRLEGTIDVFDIETGELRRVLKGHTDRVTSLVFFKDGRTLLSGCRDGSIRFWDMETGQERMTLDCGKEVLKVAISSDNNTVGAALFGGGIRVWRTSNAVMVAQKQTFSFVPPPGWLNRAAWVLATSPIVAERNGKHALELAIQACEQTQYGRHEILDTLAVACAETGDFGSAIKWQQAAIDLFTNGSDPNLERDYENRLEKYKAGTAWYKVLDSPSSPPKTEGEWLTVSGDGGQVEIQFEPKYHWSDNAQLWWRDANVDDALKIQFNVPKAGTYRVAAHLTKAPDYGIVQLAINGQKCDKSMDRYFETVAHDDVELGTFELKEETNQMTVEIVGSNEKAIHRHMFGLDYFTFELAIH